MPLGPRVTTRVRQTEKNTEGAVRTVAVVGALLALVPVLPARGSDADPSSIKFYAYDWDDQGHVVGRASILCGVLGPNGFEELGRTNQQGEITVGSSQLFRPGNLAVMFCPESSQTQCAAIRLDTSFLRGFTEYNVRVTAPEIIDRSTVAVPPKSKRK
jgi:hypothetical protein